MNIHEKLIPLAEAATRAGMTVHVPTKLYAERYAGYAVVTQDEKPGVALIQLPTFPTFEPVSIDVPITPSRQFGSGVLQDYDGTVEDGVRLLLSLMEHKTCMPRFVENPRAVSVDRRIPYGSEVYAI